MDDGYEQRRFTDFWDTLTQGQSSVTRSIVEAMMHANIQKVVAGMYYGTITFKIKDGVVDEVIPSPSFYRGKEIFRKKKP